MIDVIGLVIFSVALVVIMILLSLATMFYIKYKNAIIKLMESSLLINDYRDRLLEEISNKDNKNIEQTEGFLKFVSDSRDWAFQYIEEVQDALQEFDKKITPVVEWSKTYGIVNGDNAHTEALEIISTAYDQLKNVLPKDTETPNN